MATNSELLQAKNNAYNETSKLYKKATDDYINSLINEYNTQVQNEKNKALQSQKSVNTKYQSQYDLNLINQLVNERKLQEKVDKLGLTNSGYNNASLAGIATSRQYADNNTSFNKAAEINTINQNLNNTLNTLLKNKNEKTASAQKALTEKNAALLKSLNNKYMSSLATLEKAKITSAAKNTSKKTTSSSSKDVVNIFTKLLNIKGPSNRLAYINSITDAGYITKTQRESLIKSLGLN